MNYMKRLMLESSTVGGYTALSGIFDNGSGLSFDFPDFSFDKDLPDFNFDSSSPTGNTATTPVSTSTPSGGGFLDGFNLNGALDFLLKGGMTWAQIKSAQNGKDVYVEDGGQKQNITPVLISKLESEAASQQMTVSQMMALLQQQKGQGDPPKDNTLKYAAIGTGVLALVGGGIMLVNNQKKK